MSTIKSVEDILPGDTIITRGGYEHVVARVDNPYRVLDLDDAQIHITEDNIVGQDAPWYDAHGRLGCFPYTGGPFPHNLDIVKVVRTSSGQGSNSIMEDII